MAEINRVLFIGSKILGLNCLKIIYSLNPEKLIGVMTIEDQQDKRGNYEAFATFCEDKKIELFCAENKVESEQIIVKLKPDFCLVVCWYWLISKNILDSVKYGFIGIHNSILPKYRGSSPLVWSIINGEDEVGYSLFSFTEEMDDGDIWHQYRKKLNSSDTISTVLDDFEHSLASVLKAIYPKIITQELVSVPQNNDCITYCALRNENDGLIDWKKSGLEIFNFIRAQTMPYPGAFTNYNGNKLIIWSARLIEKIFYGTPGQIAKKTNDGVYIICGDSRAIEIIDVNYKGQNLLARDVVKSLQDRLK